MITILLADDDPHIRSIVIEYAQAEDWQFIESEDGLAALQQLEKNTLSLVVLDVMMPRLDGWTVLKQLRKNSQTPVILLTARDEEYVRLLGFELGVARAVGAIGLSVIIGLCMHLIFRKEEAEKARLAANEPEVEASRPLWQNVVYIGSMVAILVFANFGKSEDSGALWTAIWSIKWYLTSASALVLGFMLVKYYGLKLWKLLTIAVPVVALAMLFPANPLLAFTAGFLGVGAFTSTEKDGELKSWFETSLFC